MLRRPLFWIGLALLSVACIAFAVRYFALAFPIVSLDIAMDRETALAEARRLALDHRLGPPDAREAASFGVDGEAQVFIELEGGGKDAFGRMLEEGLYAAYTWRVRHFKEGETNETLFRFTPDGRPYGFRERIKEDAPGASLPGAQARTMAESGAREAWRVDLDAYRLVEQSQEVRPGGRVDHTFVYERPDRQLNEGRYRLRLVVSGDRLTELGYFIKVPEAFSRRYEEMRSANFAINIGSSVAMLLLYIVGGVGVGLFVLLRQRWVLWRQAVLWGVIVAALQVLAMLNQWPLMWMTYDTALSMQTYVVQQIAQAVALFVGFSVLLSLSFMAAESLTRRAFPHHPQLWRLWSRDAASSRAVLGRTAAGYLLVGAFFAYEVALYFVSTRLLGWWTPSDLLFHPDVLASYLPWLTAIALSFQAGFWEECLFRAVPIAGAILIAERFGGRRAWLAGAFAVQAVIFGAGHAAYATQPAYARLIELIIPSIAFGLLYLRFGLLPAIILHFVFDVTWFALPLFVSRAPGVWVDQLMVVLLALVPLWVVLGQRRRAGRWQEIGRSQLNGGWTPPAVEPPPPIETMPVAPAAGLSRRVARGVAVAGVAGLVAWVVARPFASEVPTFSTTRQAAAEAARRVIREQGARLDDRWRVLPDPRNGSEPAHRFVWETAGRQRFFELLGAHLNPPHWHVRVVTFEGDVAERAEEWQVLVTADGSIDRIRHQLPEARPGATLNDTQARALAHAAARERLGLDPARLKEVSATPSKLKARTDWVFTFTDTTVAPLPRGEPRVSVSIAGDEVVYYPRFVHVPEEWQRQQRNERTAGMVVGVLGGLVLTGLVLAGAVGAVVSWSRRNFSVRLALAPFATMAVVAVAAFLNGWPSTLAQFSTAQPLQLQMLVAAIVALAAATALPAVMALGAGAAPRWARGAGLPRAVAIELGVALGLIAAGATALGGLARAAEGPIVPAFAGAGRFVPLAAPATATLGSYVGGVVILMLIFAGVDRFSSGWTRRRALAGAALVLIGLMLGTGGAGERIAAMLIAGALAGVLLLAAYVLVVRVDVSVVPLAMAVMAILGLTREAAYRAYPGALPGNLLAAVLVALLAWWWFGAIRRDREGTRS